MRRFPHARRRRGFETPRAPAAPTPASGDPVRNSSSGLARAQEDAGHARRPSVADVRLRGRRACRAAARRWCAPGSHRRRARGGRQGCLIRRAKVSKAPDPLPYPLQTVEFAPQGAYGRLNGRAAHRTRRLGNGFGGNAMASFNEGGHAIHAPGAECAPVSVRAKGCPAQGLTRPGGGPEYNRRVGSPGRRVAGSPGRRVAGSPGRRVTLPASSWWRSPKQSSPQPESSPAGGRYDTRRPASSPDGQETSPAHALVRFFGHVAPSAQLCALILSLPLLFGLPGVRLSGPTPCPDYAAALRRHGAHRRTRQLSRRQRPNVES